MRTMGIVGVLMLLACSLTYAESVPALVNYQGFLSDSNGVGLNGTRNLEFNLYDAASGTNKVWGPQVFTNVPLINGHFNVILGPADQERRDLSWAFTGKDRFLGM